MLTNKKTNDDSNIRDLQKVFNDGICEIYSTNERQLGSLLGTFRFCEESVGVSAYWEAHVNNVNVAKAISIPLSPISINTLCVAKISNVYYEIVRTQYHDNKKPYYVTLTLQKAVFAYEASSESI